MAVRIRSRYIGDRDATVGVAIYVGEPPLLLDNCVVEEVSWSWASTSDNGVVTVADAGGGTLTLYDPDRRFDPANDQATDPLTKIGTRVQVIVAGVPAFTGRVDDVAHDLTTAQVALVDDISALASVQFVETAVPAETAAARIGRILDLAAWPAAKRDVTAGGVNLQAGTVAADAWSELVEVNRNELGALWVRPDGAVAFRPRATAWAQNPTAQMTFGCPPSDVPLVALATRGDQSDLVNVLSAARRTGTQRTVTDALSLSTFGRHSHVQNDLEVASDPLRDAWQDFYLRRQAQPIRGVGGFACRPGAAAIAKALALPFGAVVQVKDEGHGPPIDRLARWVGTRWKIEPHRVELVAVTGEDASFKPVTRSMTIDTPAEWEAASMGLKNGGFESGTTGWGTLAPGHTVVATPSSGAYALQLVAPSPVAQGNTLSDPIPVTPGMFYVGGCTYRGSSGNTGTGRIGIDVRWYDAAGAQISAVGLVNVAPGNVATWVYVTAVTAPAVPGNAVTARLAIYNGVSGVVAGDTSYIDDVFFGLNAAYRDPGAAVRVVPAIPADHLVLRDILEAVADVERPTPSEDG
jgi:hypothetical protein